MSDSKKKDKMEEDLFIEFNDDYDSNYLDQETQDYYKELGIKIVPPEIEESEEAKEKKALMNLLDYCKRDITTILVPKVVEGKPTTYHAKNIDNATSDEMIAWAKHAIPSLQLSGVVLNGRKDKVTLFETVVTYLVSLKSYWKNTGAKSIK